MRLIGKGESGSVYKDGDFVHKRFRKKRDYVREEKMLELFKDSYVVIDIQEKNPNKKTLVYDYLPHVLEDLIIQDKLSVKNKILILKHIAEFLLETEKLGVCHNDFKAKNIMVEDDKESIQIIDFDLSNHSQSHENDIETFRVLLLQIIFNKAYMEVYNNYDDYVDQLNEEKEHLLPLLGFDTIDEIYGFINSLDNVL